MSGLSARGDAGRPDHGADRRQIVQVDAFTDVAFRGNPAAVMVLAADDPIATDDAAMLNIAQEMNLSETAFVYPLTSGGFSLRWFTPAAEVALCGHATLATAHVLFEQGVVPADTVIQFHTKSGVLTAEKKDSTVQLDFPATPVRACGSEDDEANRVLSALGCTGADATAASDIARALFVGRTVFDFFVELDSEQSIDALKPDMTRLRTIDTRGVIVTAHAQRERDGHRPDFISRFFAPRVAIDEDPVTGSAHCSLAVYWADRLGKVEMLGYQASSRSGLVGVTLVSQPAGPDAGPGRVLLRGSAITVLVSDLLWRYKRTV